MLCVKYLHNIGDCFNVFYIVLLLANSDVTEMRIDVTLKSKPSAELFFFIFFFVHRSFCWPVHPVKQPWSSLGEYWLLCERTTYLSIYLKNVIIYIHSLIHIASIWKLGPVFKSEFFWCHKTIKCTSLYSAYSSLTVHLNAEVLSSVPVLCCLLNEMPYRTSNQNIDHLNISVLKAEQ